LIRACFRPKWRLQIAMQTRIDRALGGAALQRCMMGLVLRGASAPEVDCASIQPGEQTLSLRISLQQS
jgi:hypothetical protein